MGLISAFNNAIKDGFKIFFGVRKVIVDDVRKRHDEFFNAIDSKIESSMQELDAVAFNDDMNEIDENLKEEKEDGEKSDVTEAPKEEEADSQSFWKLMLNYLKSAHKSFIRFLMADSGKSLSIRDSHGPSIRTSKEYNAAHPEKFNRADANLTLTSTSELTPNSTEAPAPKPSTPKSSGPLIAPKAYSAKKKDEETPKASETSTPSSTEAPAQKATQAPASKPSTPAKKSSGLTAPKASSAKKKDE